MGVVGTSKSTGAISINVGGGVTLNIGMIGETKGQVWLSTKTPEGATRAVIDPSQPRIGLGPVTLSFKKGSPTVTIKSGLLSGSITFNADTTSAQQGQVTGISLRIGKAGYFGEINFPHIDWTGTGVNLAGTASIVTPIGKFYPHAILVEAGTPLSFSQTLGFTTANVFGNYATALQQAIAEQTGDEPPDLPRLMGTGGSTTNSTVNFFYPDGTSTVVKAGQPMTAAQIAAYNAQRDVSAAAILIGENQAQLYAGTNTATTDAVALLNNDPGAIVNGIGVQVTQTNGISTFRTVQGNVEVLGSFGNNIIVGQ